MFLDIKSKIKRIILKLSGKYNHLKKSVKCNYKWYGNSYGGFYVCPDLLNEKSIIYSFGIGEDISFDEEIINNHSCNIYGFDPTPKSINWLKNNNNHEKFRFYDYGISNRSGLVDFYLPKNPKHVSGSTIIQNNIDIKEKILVEMKTISDIINELGHKHIDVLKMDIEGAEYDVIEDICNTKISISQILIEFHERFFENGKQKTKQTIEKLSSYGYEIFAISDSFEEISFINTKYI